MKCLGGNRGMDWHPIGGGGGGGVVRLLVALCQGNPDKVWPTWLEYRL